MRGAHRPRDAPLQPETQAAVTPEKFFDELRHDLVGAMTLRLGSRSIGEEIAQDAMARAWERWSDVSLMANPKGWVYRVAFDLAGSRWRRHFAERRALQRLGAHPEPVLWSVESIELHAALAELSPRQKEVIILRYFVECSVAETAEALGISDGTVKTQTHRAIARLRRHIDLPEVDPPLTGQGGDSSDA